MNRVIRHGRHVAAVLLALATASVGAEEPPPLVTGAAGSYLRCAQDCGEDFYFSEKSAKPFADLRRACLAGCAVITEEQLPVYRGCYRGCQKTFRYRHGIDRAFAGFQGDCVRGCAAVLEER